MGEVGEEEEEAGELRSVSGIEAPSPLRPGEKDG